MQKWEYCSVLVTIGGPISGTYGQTTRYFPDGKHKKSDEMNDIGLLIASLGCDGWEMVASNARVDAGLNKGHKVEYLFKRPLS